jgi:hypothetical protein
MTTLTSAYSTIFHENNKRKTTKKWTAAAHGISCWPESTQRNTSPPKFQGNKKDQKGNSPSVPAQTLTAERFHFEIIRIEIIYS